MTIYLFSRILMGQWGHQHARTMLPACCWDGGSPPSRRTASFRPHRSFGRRFVGFSSSRLSSRAFVCSHPSCTCVLSGSRKLYSSVALCVELKCFAEILQSRATGPSAIGPCSIQLIASETSVEHGVSASSTRTATYTFSHMQVLQALMDS